MKIAYRNENGGVSIITPVDLRIPVDEIAKKDVPFEVPYLLVNEEDLRDDWHLLEAWTCDFSKPDGYGLGHDRWTIGQLYSDIGKIRAAIDTMGEGDVSRDALLWVLQSLTTSAKEIQDRIDQESK